MDRRLRNGKNSKIAIVAVILLALILLAPICIVTVQAAGLLEESVNNGLEYTRYPSKYYELDFVAKKGWIFDTAISELIPFMVNGLAQIVWGLSRTLSGFTINVVEQAMTLDFLAMFSDTVGGYVQAAFGVSATGFNRNGMLFGFLLLLILILGIYVVYEGLIKRSSSKALSAVTGFVIAFVLAIAIIAYLPSLLHNVQELSSDVNDTVLSVAANLMSEGEVAGANSEEYMANLLWRVLVKKPWLILNFGDTSVLADGSSVEELAEILLQQGFHTEERVEMAKELVEAHNISIMTSDDVWSRLADTIIVAAANVGICYFVIMLMALMIMYQLMFILFIAAAPFVFMFAMLPNGTNRITGYVLKLFNTLMARTVVLFVLTFAFSMSSMAYSLTGNGPFLFIAFLQLLIFGGVLMNMSKIMGLLGVDPGGGQLFMSPGRQTSRIFMMNRLMHLNKRAKASGGSNGGSNGSPPSYQSSSPPPARNQNTTSGNSTGPAGGAPAPGGANRPGFSDNNSNSAAFGNMSTQSSSSGASSPPPAGGTPSAPNSSIRNSQSTSHPTRQGVPPAATTPTSNVPVHTAAGRPDSKGITSQITNGGDASTSQLPGKPISHQSAPSDPQASQPHSTTSDQNRGTNTHSGQDTGRISGNGVSNGAANGQASGNTQVQSTQQNPHAVRVNTNPTARRRPSRDIKSNPPETGEQ